MSQSLSLLLLSKPEDLESGFQTLSELNDDAKERCECGVGITHIFLSVFAMTKSILCMLHPLLVNMIRNPNKPHEDLCLLQMVL